MVSLIVVPAPYLLCGQNNLVEVTEEEKKYNSEFWLAKLFVCWLDVSNVELFSALPNYGWTQEIRYLQTFYIIEVIYLNIKKGNMCHSTIYLK